MDSLESSGSNFKAIVQEYYNARVEQRGKISRFLDKESGFTKSRGSNGNDKYKSGSRLKAEYNLSNWQWINATRNNVNFVISLQTFDRNPVTQDLHVLMDRIGIYAYVGEYSAKDAQNEMMITNFQLPLNGDDLVNLKKLLVELSECEFYHMQAKLKDICDRYNLVKV